MKGGREPRGGLEMLRGAMEGLCRQAEGQDDSIEWGVEEENVLEKCATAAKLFQAVSRPSQCSRSDLRLS